MEGAILREEDVGTGRLGDVPAILEEVVAACPVAEAKDLAAIEAADREARDFATGVLERRGQPAGDGRA